MLADNHLENIVHSHKQQYGFLKTSRAAYLDAVYMRMANVVFITSHHVHRMTQ